METTATKISKEELAAALRRRPVAARGGIHIAAAERAAAFACAVIISKKVATLATARNRLRRRVRESLRRVSGAAQQPLRCVVVIRRADIPEGGELSALLVELLRESGILIP